MRLECGIHSLDVWKPACDRLVAYWSSTMDIYYWRNYKKNDEEFNCSTSSHSFQTLNLEIRVSRDNICYREGYAISIADVFSSIGGDLGFFLGGSIVSIIQCGIIGYKQILAGVGKATKLRRRKVECRKVEVVGTV